MKIKAKHRHEASTEARLTGLAAFEAGRFQDLELQLLSICKRFTEGCARDWGMDPNTMQTQVDRDTDYERDELVFTVRVRSPWHDYETEVSDSPAGDGPLTLLGLQMTVATLLPRRT